MFLSVCTRMCYCACVQISLHWKRFIIGPVSAVSLPKGKKVEMRDRKMHGRAPCTHGCHTPVPNGRHAGHYDVFQMDTSVCFPRNKSAKSRERVVNKASLVVFYLFIDAIASCVDVMIYLQTFRDTSRNKNGVSDHTCYDVNTVLEATGILSLYIVIRMTIYLNFYCGRESLFITTVLMVLQHKCSFYRL